MWKSRKILKKTGKVRLGQVAAVLWVFKVSLKKGGPKKVPKGPKKIKKFR